jgi:hypothetical protein
MVNKPFPAVLELPAILGDIACHGTIALTSPGAIY